MRRLVAISLASALGAMLLPALAASAATTAIEVREATNVRSIYTSEFGESRPAALTYSPVDEALFTADDTVDGTMNLVGVTTVEDAAGEVTATIPETTTTADTLAFDPITSDFTALSGDVLVSITPTGVVERRNVSDLGLQAPQGATFDRAGRWYILDQATQTILQLSSATDPAATVASIPIRGLAGLPLQGLAFNKADGLLYTMDRTSKILYGIDKGGRVQRAWDLNARVRDPGSMVFAPSADNTDDPAETSLFLADSGSDAVLGQVLEVSLAAAIAAPVNQNATLVRTSNLANLNPPVPDSAGIAYIPSQNNLMVVDSEVEEMSIYRGANMWKLTLTGGLVQTGTTVAFSNEPTGAGFRTANSQFFISDDDANRVFLDRPGPDGRWGNADDLTGNVNTRNFGSEDAEGSAFNNNNNHYYVIDGVGTEVYDIAPGPNGVPGNGVAPQGDDVATHFDVGQFGARDPEGIAVDESNNHIFVLDHKTETIYETSPTGTLLRAISISAANPINAAGLEYARSSANASVMSFYIVDRGLDNDSNPNENDGKMYEMSVGGAATNTAPVVNAGQDQTITLPNSATLSGTVTDDGLPNPPGATTKTWSKTSGPGTVTFSNPNNVNTTASFSVDGTYVLRLTANDSALSGFDELTVTVNPQGGGGGTPVILNRSIAAGSDDAEQQASGAVDLVSSDIELVQDGSSNNQTDGLRFTNITVPSGATITNAYIQFQVDEVTTATPVNLTVRGELNPNPVTFTTATNNVSSRPNTAASVAWSNVPTWPTVGARGQDQRTPEIKSIVQELIGQAGWASGNAMAFKITGTGKRTAEAFESGAARAASLHIEYTT